MKVEILTHSSIRFTLDDKIIYFDPFKIKEKTYDADVIFITHKHFDHYSIDDIKKIINKDTILVMPYGTNPEGFNNIKFVEPNKEYKIDDLSFKTTYSYNKNKDFHKKEFGFVGYILNIENSSYYVMGDTDLNDDIKDVKTDYIFIPIGGTYTFDHIEAAKYINTIKPKCAYATHYLFNESGINVVDEFIKLVDKNIEVLK